jgi:hypothetical protein
VTEHGALRVLVLTLVLSIAASSPGRPDVVSLDFAGLCHTNTRVAPAGDLVIDEVRALDLSDTWYRYPWGYGVWDIQLRKDAGAAGFTGSEACLKVVDNVWAIQPLHAFNSRLMRAGPAASGGYVATLATGIVLPVPGFASRPGYLRFLTFGSHSGWSSYTITLNYKTGGPTTIVVPIAGADVYPRDGSGAGWLTQAVTDFVSVCTGHYGDMVQIANPRPSTELTSVVIAYDLNLSGPIAVSLSIDEMGYETGYSFSGSAESGADQLTALRAPEGTVAWQGVDWSATIPDPYSEITVDVYCGEPGSGGSVWWEYAGTFALGSGTGSADLAQPCSGEFVKCTVDMVAELADSPLLHSLTFRYAGSTGVGGGPQRGRVRLEAGVPNPFRSTTTIRFDLAAAGPVRLAVFDVSGRWIRTLIDADLPPGARTAVWDGRDSAGRAVESGSYFVRLDAEGTAATLQVRLAR